MRSDIETIAFLNNCAEQNAKRFDDLTNNKIIESLERVHHGFNGFGARFVTLSFIMRCHDPLKVAKLIIGKRLKFPSPRYGDVYLINGDVESLVTESDDHFKVIECFMQNAYHAVRWEDGYLNIVKKCKYNRCVLEIAKLRKTNTAQKSQIATLKQKIVELELCPPNIGGDGFYAAQGRFERAAGTRRRSNSV